jgi:hypothetical protein
MYQSTFNFVELIWISKGFWMKPWNFDIGECFLQNPLIPKDINFQKAQTLSIYVVLYKSIVPIGDFVFN